MSSDPALPLRELPPPPSAAVVPIFVCPGVKETAMEQLVFPHGGGFTQLTACPGRDICLWYAAHDLGGREAINELPPEAVVAADFRTAPFSCKHFQELKARHPAARPSPPTARRHWRAAALAGLVELVGLLAVIDLTDALVL